MDAATSAIIATTYDWTDSEIDCQRYEVTAYAEH